jgi:hypothetical protein
MSTERGVVTTPSTVTTTATSLAFRAVTSSDTLVLRRWDACFLMTFETLEPGLTAMVRVIPRGGLRLVLRSRLAEVGPTYAPILRLGGTGLLRFMLVSRHNLPKK